MSTLRAILRLGGMTVWTLVLFLLLLGSQLSRLVSSGAALRAQGWCFGNWARGLLWILGVRVRSEGSPPGGACFLVSNHLGYLDILVLATRAPFHFVSKSEVARWPVMGLLARSVNTIFVDRSRRADLPRVIAQMDRVMAAGSGVLFFPEGTSSPGDRVLPFKPSLFEAAARRELPVICASLRYLTRSPAPPPGEAVCWWGEMGFGGHFWRLLGLPGVRAELRFSQRRLHGDDRKGLAQRAQEEVERLFRPCAREGPA